MRKRVLLNLINAKLDFVIANLADVERKCDRLAQKLESIMATQEQLLEQINAVNAKLVKIGQETTTLLSRIEELTVIIQTNPVPAPVQAAMDALTAQAQVVDDLVPDSPSPPSP